MDTTNIMRDAFNTVFDVDGRFQRGARRGAIALSVILILLFARALVADIRIPTVSSPAREGRPLLNVHNRLLPLEDAARVGQAHLFGQANMTAAAIPLQTVSDITLSGILFSDHEDESRAILVIGGQMITAAAGDTLPDNGILHSIGEDRVTLDRNGTLVSVLLDIKKADTNSRTALIALGNNASGDDTGPAAAPMSGPDAERTAASWTSQQGMGQGRIAHENFLPLSAIRGDPAKLRIMTPSSKNPDKPQ